jgi:hypothetical protein
MGNFIPMVFPNPAKLSLFSKLPHVIPYTFVSYYHNLQGTETPAMEACGSISFPQFPRQ